MESYEVIREVLRHEDISAVKASHMMGQTKTYIGSLLSKKNDQKSGNLARMLDALDYDLLARSRKDGAEFFISPKE